MYLIDYYMNQGKSITEAMALTCASLYSDNVTVLISENFPDQIFALRTTRPMQVIMENGETYMSTSRFGFPHERKTDPVDLPLFHACSVSRDGISITADRMQAEEVGALTPYTYKETYNYIEKLLRSEKALLYFDDLEFAIGKMRSFFPGDHTCIQHASIIYEVLWQLDQEGRLKRELRTQQRPHGTRERYYMWLED